MRPIHRSRITALLVLAISAASLSAAGAQTTTDTEDTTVEATVTTLEGTRLISSVPAVTLGTVAGASVSGALAVVVAETSAAGVNPWSVTAALSDLTATIGTKAATIPKSAVAVSGRSVTSATTLLTGVAATAPEGSSALSGAVKLFDVTGQDTAAFYTNDYTSASTLTLTPPDGTLAGTYTGTLTVTLLE